jgi:hypothetical protein
VVIRVGMLMSVAGVVDALLALTLALFVDGV